MSRLDVIIIEDTKVRSRSYTELLNLADAAEITVEGVPEQKLRRMMTVVRAIFDGRQYSVKRPEAIELYTQIYGTTDFSHLATYRIVYGIALYFWTPVIAPVAAVLVTPTTGDAPLPVRFESLSTGNIVSYVWDFGDGNFAYDILTGYVYTTPGTYNGSLTVSNPISAPDSQGFTVVVDAP